MPYTSLYPTPPPVSDQNHHYALSGFETSGPADYVLHIDGLTGRKRTRKEFDERVLHTLTVITAPTSQGGLGLNGNAGDVVGILSFNCMVSLSTSVPAD